MKSARYTGHNTLKVCIPANSEKRQVRWTKVSPTQRETPGELTPAQWKHLKIQPTHLPITDIEKNVGKLMTYPALRESFAQLVAFKTPYRKQTEKDGILGTSEITDYHFTKAYMEQPLRLSHFAPIENLVCTIVKKQLRNNPSPDYQAAKAVFINKSMIPRWQCTLLALTPETGTMCIWKIIDSLMNQFVILDLKITTKRIEESPSHSEIFLELWTKVVKKEAIGNLRVTGLFDSKYPKITYAM